MSSQHDKTSVLVVGAGIIGLSVALRLHLDGHNVTIVDAQNPMNGCSAGNAGCLSEANIYPPVAPDILARLPALLLSRDGPLIVRPSYFGQMLPWFRLASRTLRTDARDRIIAAMAAMTTQAVASFDELVIASDAADLLTKKGLLVAFRTMSALEEREQRLPIWHRYGIQVERLAATEVLDRVPALHQDMAGGLLFAGSGHCRDPYQLGMRYLERLRRGGAQFVQTKVISVDMGTDGRARAATSGGMLTAERMVVCAGYQSKALLQPFGHRVPLAAERGYHLMLPHPGLSMDLPVIFGEPYFAATPMAHGIRLAGTAEFARFDARPDFKRASMLFRQAKRYFPQLDDRDAVPWTGVRPSFPDGMPAIGRLEEHPRILYAFGHGHNGLTLSAITARCISALIDDRDVGLSIDEMSLRRFQS